MKMTDRKLRALIKEEKKAAKEYRRYGLFTIAGQELNHSVILARILKRRATCR